MNKIITIAKYTSLEVRRSRLFWSLFIGILVVLGISLFAGQLAITERGSLEVSMMAALLRVSSVLFVALIVITSMLRERQDKQLELVLSLPIERSSYFLGKWLGYSWVSFVVAFVVSLPLYWLADFYGAMAWSISLALELLLVLTVSMLFQFTFNQVPGAMLGVMGFYGLSRSVSALQLISENPIASSGEVSQSLMTSAVQGLGYLLPHLDQFTQSRWLVDGVSDSMVMLNIALQSIIYVVLLSLASMFDLYRKKVN